MMIPKLVRWARRRGVVVQWGNMVGMHRGQEGKWTFATEEDAQIFERYAVCEPVPSLSDEDMAHAGIPLPVAREGDL